VDVAEASEAIRNADSMFLKVLSMFPDNLRAVRPQPSEWSAAEVLAHDWAVEGRYIQQVRAAVNRESLRMAGGAGIQPENPPPWDQLIAEYLAIRDEEVGLFQSVSPDEWSRKWTHWTFGEVDFEWLARRAIQHTLDGTQQCLMALNLLTCGNHEAFQSPS
jgi:hypothetical protein